MRSETRKSVDVAVSVVAIQGAMMQQVKVGDAECLGEILAKLLFGAVTVAVECLETLGSAEHSAVAVGLERTSLESVVEMAFITVATQQTFLHHLQIHQIVEISGELEPPTVKPEIKCLKRTVGLLHRYRAIIAGPGVVMTAAHSNKMPCRENPRKFPGGLAIGVNNKKPQTARGYGTGHGHVALIGLAKHRGPIGVFTGPRHHHCVVRLPFGPHTTMWRIVM